MITLTKNAIQKLKDLIQKQNKGENSGLRIFVRGGGCAGYQYGFEMEDGMKENDHVMVFDGIKVFLDKKSALFIIGSEIDYEETFMASGFRVKNPNAESSCGCGTSFSV